MSSRFIYLSRQYWLMTFLGRSSLKSIIIYLALAAALGLGLWLRWQFVHTVQLYPDEFVTLLAVRMIGETGLPVMPSGLFYDHGLLFSYLGSLAGLFGSAPWAARYASLLCGLLTLLLIFGVGRRWFSTAVGLLAVAGLAIAPAAIHWSGRARMYALLQLLILLALWLAYEGVIQNRARLRWLALLAYLGAVLTQFAAVALAPPLAAALLAVRYIKRATEPGRRGTEVKSPLPRFKRWQIWLEVVALGLILLIAFLVKRAGQPKGIEPLDGSAGQAVTGLVQVFQIYSDFSFNIMAGWQAIAPFFFTLPALIFIPFALIAALYSLALLTRSPQLEIQNPKLKTRLSPPGGNPKLATLFLALILVITSLEMILLVSPDRRDDKYQFMLLPALLLLGGQGMSLLVGYLSLVIRRSSSSNSQPSAIYNFLTILLTALILTLTWPKAQTLLANTGDDYDSAFAYVQAHWREGDTILTGTPAAAAFYLNRNDFYSVQRRGGYDYRILTLDNRPVDRWLASPAIRTEADLHQTLANHRVWLVLERWGLQREYYDLPFQQQLLAQTDYITESQGIFILRSKANPQPLQPAPAHPAQAVLGQVVKLTGYTLEPEQPSPGESLRLTLYWEALNPVLHNYTVFVHLRRPEGGNVAQADHRPLDNLYPTTLWPVGETIRESSLLAIPPDLPPGRYELWVGMYLLETGERLPVQNDTSGENAVRLGELDVE